MIESLNVVKNFVKTKSYHIDFPLFRIHYRATVAILLTFSFILTAKVLFGDNIDCKGKAGQRDKYWDNICHSQGTTTTYAISSRDWAISVRRSNREVPPDISNLIENPIKTHRTSNFTLIIDQKAQLEFVEVLNNTHANCRLRYEVVEDSIGKKIAGQVLKVMGTNDDYEIISKVLEIYPSHKFGNYIPEGKKTVHIDLNSETSKYLNHFSNNITTDHHTVAHPLTQELINSAPRFKSWNFFRKISDYLRKGVHYDPTVRYIAPGIMVPVSDKYLTVSYRHMYYQYIPILLLAQATLFYFPHYMWKIWENGSISSVCKRLQDNRFAPAEFIESNYQIVEYINNLISINKSLVFKYYFCHLLLLLNLIGQIFALDLIFNNQFIAYGYDFIVYQFFDSDIYGFRSDPNTNIKDLNNPMDNMFPKISECLIYELSSAGGHPDASNFMCVLPLNVLHDKIFLMVWFWFFILLVVTSINMLFDSIYLIVPKIRRCMFRRKFGLSLTTKHNMQLSELFLLELIGNNCDKFAFTTLLKKLGRADVSLGTVTPV